MIQIDLTPEEEERLRERAASRGASPEALAAELLRGQLLPTGSQAAGELLPVLDEQRVFHRERLAAVHQYFQRLSKGRPAIPLEALTREALYQDQD